MKTKSDPQPGLEARMNTECRRCGKAIRKAVDRIIYDRGWQIHVACADRP